MSECELCRYVLAEAQTIELDRDGVCVIFSCIHCKGTVAALQQHRPQATEAQREHMRYKLRLLVPDCTISDDLDECPEHYHMHARA